MRKDKDRGREGGRNYNYGGGEEPMQGNGREVRKRRLWNAVQCSAGQDRRGLKKGYEVIVQ